MSYKEHLPEGLAILIISYITSWILHQVLNIVVLFLGITLCVMSIKKIPYIEIMSLFRDPKKFISTILSDNPQLLNLVSKIVTNTLTQDKKD